jgi:hypothetical protein
LFEFLSGPLQHRAVYRNDRQDVEFPVLDHMTVPEALEYSASHPHRIAKKDGIHYPDRGRVLPVYQGLGDYASFQARRLARRLTGHEQRSSRRGREQSGGEQPLKVDLAYLGRRFLDRLDAATALALLPKLHTNACGDFTLMARDDWFDLRGYPEWAMYSWNLDSVFLYQAHAHGLRFVELPPAMSIFHIEHDEGSGWTPEGREALFSRIDRSGTPYLSDRDLRKSARRIQRYGRAGRPPLYNGDEWGMADEALPELEATAKGGSVA